MGGKHDPEDNILSGCSGLTNGTIVACGYVDDGNNKISVLLMKKYECNRSLYPKVTGTKMVNLSEPIDIKNAT